MRMRVGVLHASILSTLVWREELLARNRLPSNTLSMMTGKGPLGPVEMSSMFTALKVREDLAADDYRDPGCIDSRRAPLPFCSTNRRKTSLHLHP